MVRLDVLDLPRVHDLEASYVVEGVRQGVDCGRGGGAHAHGGIVPAPMFERSARTYTLLRHSRGQVRAALLALACGPSVPEAAQVSDDNPGTAATRRTSSTSMR